MFRTFAQAIANMQCPSNKNIAFIDKGISWAIVVDIDRLSVTAFSWTCALVFNFLMNVRTCFYWNQVTVASVMCPPVLEDLLRQSDLILYVHWAWLCLAIFLSSAQPSRNLLSSSSLLHRQHSALKRNQSLHQWFLPVSLCSKRSKAI